MRLPTALGYLRTMAVFFVVWALIARWTGNPVLLPSPLAVGEAFAALAADLELFRHAAISFGRMLLSVGIAAVIAIPLGLAMGLSRTLDAIVDPTIEVLRPIWTTKTETASRVRQRIEAVLDYATATKARTGENPARWKGHLDHLLAKPSKVRRVLAQSSGETRRCSP